MGRTYLPRRTPGLAFAELARSAGRAPDVRLELLAVPPVEAARLLSMSRDRFDRYVRNELRLVRVGRKVLVPVAELERWLAASAKGV